MAVRVSVFLQVVLGLQTLEICAVQTPANAGALRTKIKNEESSKDFMAPFRDFIFKCDLQPL